MERQGADCCYHCAHSAPVAVIDKGIPELPPQVRISAALDGILVLVAEDEAVIALDVAMAICDAGGQVAGPAASIKQALALISQLPIGAAILDVNLSDGDITLVAEILLAAGIPTILQTGVGLPADLIAQFPNLTVQMKPCASESLVAQLALVIANRQAVEGS